MCVCVSKSPVSQTGRGLVVLRRGGEVGRLTQKNYMRAFPMNDIDFFKPQSHILTKEMGLDGAPVKKLNRL